MYVLGMLASPTSCGLVQPSKDLQCFATCSLAAKKSVQRHQSALLVVVLFWFGVVSLRFWCWECGGGDGVGVW